ncbi:zinc finger CCCH domain-containing protein 19-like protein [Tanacetum coccineum]
MRNGDISVVSQFEIQDLLLEYIKRNKLRDPNRKSTTSEGARYTLSKRTTCTMLEILNLDKTETISIDSISNQEFTEDECKRLRQSIKCGLISTLTVGDVLDKATELQVVRVNDTQLNKAIILDLNNIRPWGRGNWGGNDRGNFSGQRRNYNRDSSYRGGGGNRQNFNRQDSFHNNSESNHNDGGSYRNEGMSYYNEGRSHNKDGSFRGGSGDQPARSSDE